MSAIWVPSLKRRQRCDMTIDSFSGERSFLSNFFPCEVEIFGDIWATNEHFFQAMKAADPGDREAIRLAATPGKAKRMGRKVALTAHWDSIKLGAMRTGLEAKFPMFVPLPCDGNDMSHALLETGDELLVEGNNWNDTFWGVCNGVGANWLGILLMARRAELRAQDA